MRPTLLAIALALALPAPTLAADDLADCLAVARDPRSTNYAAAGCPSPHPVRISHTPFASSIFDAIRDRLPVIAATTIGAPTTSSADPAVVPPAPGAPESDRTPAPRPERPARTPNRTPDGFRCHPAYEGCIVPKLPRGQDVNCSDLDGATPRLIDPAVDPYRLDTTNGRGDGIACNGDQ